MLAPKNYQSPNAIDAGDDAPPVPSTSKNRRVLRGGGRRGLAAAYANHTRSPRSVVRVQERIASDERLFRGTRIKISENSSRSNSSSSSDSSSLSGNEIEGFGDDEGNNPSPILPHRNKRRTRRSITYEQNDGEEATRTALRMERGGGDDEEEASPHDQLPSPDEARLYAASLLTESFRYNNAQNNSDYSDEENLAVKQNRMDDGEEDNVHLLPKSTWRRPSRRQPKNAATSSHNHDNEESRRSAKYLCTTIGCSVLLLATALAFVIVVSMAAAKKSGSVDVNNNKDSNTLVTTDSSSSPRYLSTVDWLTAHQISDQTALTTAGSPQFLAAVWMADVDALQEDIPVTIAVDEDTLPTPHDNVDAFLNTTTDSTVVTQQNNEEGYHRHVMYERFLQRYVLALLYFSLGGAEWTYDLDFLTASHECGWFRAEKGNDDLEYAVGVTCNSKLLVKDIFIVNNNLKGSVPSELQFLQHLEMLSFRHNAITGSIPSELSHLSSTLAYLDLSKNSLEGTLSQSIGSLKHLKALGLADNAMDGTLPSGLGDLTHLITLDVENNAFSGNVQTSIGSLTNLKYLYLSSNQFGDELDASFLINLEQLEELKMNNNQFKSNSELPTHFFSHSSLTLLDMSDNELQSSFAPTVGPGNAVVNPPLKFLSLKNNQLQSSIPLLIQSLRNLEFLDLSQNSLVGSLPVSLGNMRALTHIHLGENNFEPGPIPPTLFTISNLRELSLPKTQLTGAIPEWMSMLSQLEYLNLSENTLTSTIPDTMWGMQSLKTLLLQSNLLDSQLPGSFPQSHLGKFVAISGRPYCSVCDS